LKKAVQVLFGALSTPGEPPKTLLCSFFEGAFDYIGPALVKKGLDKKRFATAQKKAQG
jgi:hypothetical protein